MSNPMKYIKDLEAVGFERTQAEAQVQMVLDAIEGDLVTKSDFAVFQERHENKLAQHQQATSSQLTQLEQSFENKLTQLQLNMVAQIKESEFRTATRLGFITVSSLTIAVAVLTWLIKM